MKPKIEDLVKRAIQADKKCVNDDLLLLAWVWAKSEIQDETLPCFCDKLGKIYTRLLKLPHPASVFREARKSLEENAHLKIGAPSTEAYRKELEGQTTFLGESPAETVDEKPLPLPPDPEKKEDRWKAGKEQLKQIKQQYEYWHTGDGKDV